MVAVLPINLVDVDEAEVRLVDQGACLQAVANALACHAGASDAIQLVMHKGDEPVERRPIATAPCEQ